MRSPVFQLSLYGDHVNQVILKTPTEQPKQGPGSILTTQTGKRCTDLSGYNNLLLTVLLIFMLQRQRCV
jgi:hypothetical protein